MADAVGPLVAVVSNYSMGAILTFAIPIGTLLLAVAIGFHQRKPISRGGRSLFPSSGLPQHTTDLKLLAAMTPEARRAVVERAEEGSAFTERPLGGR